MTTIIDRTSDGNKDALPNRQRFINRYNRRIKDAVKEAVKDIKIKNVGSKDVEVTIDGSSLIEPSFEHQKGTGVYDTVFPGNKKYRKGTKIPKPYGGQGNGSQAGRGEGEDDYTFKLTKEEFLDFFFADLELPNLVKKVLCPFDTTRPIIQGVTRYGSPSRINIRETFKNAFAREMIFSQQQNKTLEEAKGKDNYEEIAQLVEKEKKKIPFVDDVDIRYDRIEHVPDNKHHAVMFCMMDVSGSMDEDMKSLAKQFFILIYLFLTKKYDFVEIRFIRHTDQAEEVSEDKFFYDRHSGGTMISTGLNLILNIIKKDYNLKKYNIYISQASDGGNFDFDNEEVIRLLHEKLLPITQYYNYIEVQPTQYAPSRFFDLMEALQPYHNNITADLVWDSSHIYPAIQELFGKN